MSARQKLSAAPETVVRLPPYYKPFLEPAPYKILEGGRGSAKSHSVATAYVIEAAMNNYRYLCTREFQSSMQDSVIKLLSDKIYELNLRSFFDITKNSIRSHYGSEFIFKGLKVDPQAIRSTEGIDRCWVEEAHVVSKDSWQVLEPTLFRRPGFELTVTFNPDVEADPTYQMFVVNPPSGVLHRHVTWQDNPWFPDGLDMQRRHMLKTDPDAYDWIWEGHCRKLSDAVIFRHRVTVDQFETPENARFYFGADWGFADDPSVLVRMFIHNKVLFIDYEAFGWHVEMNDLGSMFDTVPGARTWPILADNARPETISYMKNHGFPRMAGADKWKGSVEDGIAFMKSFEKIVVHPRCPNIAQEFRLYSYKVEPKTNRVLPVIVDRHNHGIDAARYGLVDLIRGGQGYFIVPDALVQAVNQMGMRR